MKYHLGCGSRYISGYLNVDYPLCNHTANNTVKADLYTDIMTMSYEPCEEIRSHHFFEHFGYVDSFKLLEKWTIALNKNGLLLIDIPDVEKLAEAILNATPEKKFRVIRYLYGSQEASWAYHINGWTKDTLEYILNKIGYKLYESIQYGDINTDYPNCGVELKFILFEKMDPIAIHKKLKNCLGVYSNGDTEFERRLTDYLRNKI